MFSFPPINLSDFLLNYSGGASVMLSLFGKVIANINQNPYNIK